MLVKTSQPKEKPISAQPDLDQQLTIANDSLDFSNNILDTLREPFLVLNDDLEVVSAAKAFYSTFKVLPEKTIGKLIYDLGNGQWNIPSLKILLEDILPNNVIITNYSVEHSFETIGQRTMLLNASRIHQKKKGGQMILLAIEDITERRQAEELLAAHKLRLDYILYNTNVGTWEWNVQTGTTTFNERWASMIGYTLDELAPVTIDTWTKLTHPDDLKRSGELLKKHFNDELDFYECEARMRHKNGSWVWVRDRGKVATWTKDHKPLLVAGTHMDITESKQAVTELQSSEHKLKTFFEFLPVGVSIEDEHRQVLEVNNALFTTIELSQQELAAGDHLKRKYIKSDGSAFHASEYPSVRAINEQIEILDTEIGIVKEDGAIIWTLVSATPLPNRQCIAITTNITDKKRAEVERLDLEAQLHQSQKLEAIGTMVGGISHEFNNVLQRMFLYAGLVQADLPENEVLHSNFQRILDGGNRARDLIKQVLTFSRKTNVEMKPRYLHELVQELLLLERASLPANIDIQQDIDMHCGLVLCDKTQIHQIIMNLCNNAQHAMADHGGTLTVSLKPTRASLNKNAPETDVLELIVSDTGQGIDKADLEKIFDPFFTTKQIGQGTGLGLSVIHGIVEMMEGQISVTSELGKGTTFRVLFPVTDVTAEHDEANSLTVADGASLCVLLADDEESIRSVTQIILTRTGFKVDSASDGKQALELFKANPEKYDLIVTDQSMPKMSGVELTKAVRATNSDIPIILSTGQLGIEDEKEFKNAGITAFIQKPWTAEELIRRIHDLYDTDMTHPPSFTRG